MRRLLVALALLAAAPASAQTPALRLDAGPLAIYYDAPFERTARELAARAPADIERISAALGLPAPPAAEVHLLPRKGAVSPDERGLPLGPDWSAGITLGSRPVIVLRTAEDHAAAGSTRVSQVFTHELVHLIAIQALGDAHHALPAWLQEGTAAHLAFEWRVADAGRALRFAIGGSMQPLARLHHGFPGDARKIGDAYFQSRAFVGWLVDEKGEERFRELWGRLLAGEEFHPAFRRSYGIRLRDMEEQWQRDFLRRYAWVPIISSATTPWVVVIGLVVAGWWRKRRRNEEKLARWAEEERALEAAETAGDEP